MSGRIFLVLLFLCTCGCTLFVANPEVRVKDVRVVGLDGNGVDLELLLLVTNPNRYDMSLNGYSYDLQVMALPFATGGARQACTFPAGLQTDIRLPVRVAFDTVFEILKRGPDPDRIPYRLLAGLDVNTPIGAVSLPVEKTGTFTVPELYRPAFYLSNLSEIFSLPR